MTLLFVAGDIGGTNSRLQLVRASASNIGRPGFQKGAGEVVVGEEIYASGQYKTLQDVIELFLRKYLGPKEQVFCMCLAVAGPVTNNIAKITNLDWVIDGAALAAHFRMERVDIINDFAGIGFGLLALEDSDLELVHGGGVDGAQPQPRAPKAVIGAGTGLGEAYLTHNGAVYDVYPCEGGHTDFAPRNQTEFAIMQHIKKTSGVDRVSVERVCSGLGLPKIYEFLAQQSSQDCNADVVARIRSGKEDVGRVIAESAKSGKCQVCVQTMDLFVCCYGAEAGNLCLKTLPFGGLYIAGGIAGKNMQAMRKNNQFVRHFLDKGRMRSVLERVPIYLITHPQVGLLGSKVICRRILFAKAHPRQLVSKL